ncbi:hypothetical protein [Nonomuraea sp. B5E05]|uniref:hypothetical protein n=1 Tax=Nonomuraea sp. B5E05 TaxID=3153569 RepID=UPI0032611B91
MIKKLHHMGFKSGHMYTAGMASIAISFTAWFMSKKMEAAGIDRADRWGIFIGEWAPSFFALGVALRIEETHRELEGPESEMYEQAETRTKTHAGV